MFFKLNNFLSKVFKIRINKVAKPIELPKNKNYKDNLTIEFYGASGVGKTTLYNYYIKNHNFAFNKPLILRKEITRMVINNKKESLGIFEYGFNSRVDNILNKPFLAFNKYIHVENIYYLALWNYIASYIIENKTIILDENDMFNPFFDLYLNEETKEIGAKYFQNKIIIYCYLDIEELVKRLKQRVAAGTHPYLQNRNFNDAEITEMAAETLYNRKRRIDILEKQNFSILKINTAESLEANTQKIDAFIAKAIEEGRLRE